MVSLARSSEAWMYPFFCLSVILKASRISVLGSSCCICLCIIVRNVEKSSSPVFSERECNTNIRSVTNNNERVIFNVQLIWLRGTWEYEYWNCKFFLVALPIPSPFFCFFTSKTAGFVGVYRPLGHLKKYIYNCIIKAMSSRFYKKKNNSNVYNERNGRIFIELLRLID